MRLPRTLTAATLLALAGTAAQAEVAHYALEATHTFVTFEALHFGTSTNRGRFDKKEGTVSIDRATKTGKLDVTIETGSINTGTAPFDKHLRGKDFFNSEAFPTARFVSDKFVFDGEKVTEVSGQLTLLGKTLPVTVKGQRFNCYPNPMLKREVCGGDFETTIQRSQWGMVYGLPGIPDNIKLIIQVEAVKQ